jgi:hypothetical protein
MAVMAFAGPVSFVTGEVEYRLGESVMIPVMAETAVAETTGQELVMDPPGIVEILQPPQILKDHDTGFARIRTLAPGEVVLKSGDSSLRVRVTDERPVQLVRKLRPRFTSPAEGSAVWGTVAIGVDLWVGAPGVDREAVPEAVLHLPDGRELAADESFPPLDGPFWRLVYQLDTAVLPPGDCTLSVTCKPPLMGGADGMPRLSSDPHTITILPPPRMTGR